MARAYALMKDLVDTPALSLGPNELANAAILIGEGIDVFVPIIVFLAYNYFFWLIVVFSDNHILNHFLIFQF